MNRPPVYPGGRRGNNSRPHAKIATTSAWQGMECFARHCAGIVATATVWVHGGSVQLASTTISFLTYYVSFKNIKVCKNVNKRNKLPVFVSLGSFYCVRQLHGPPVYPGGQRGNNARPRAKIATASAWQGVARFARHSVRG